MCTAYNRKPKMLAEFSKDRKKLQVKRTSKTIMWADMPNVMAVLPNIGGALC